MKRTRQRKKHILAILLMLLCVGSILCVSCGKKNEDGRQQEQEGTQTDSVSAVTMRMVKADGTVAVQDKDGGEVALQEPLLLHDGYGLTSQTDSYAWISLDDTKLAKLDQDSGASVHKDGKKLEMVSHYGSLFFHVTKALEEEESLDIRVGTLSVGIRGTCGWVCRQETNGIRYMAYILEGNVTCEVENTAAVTVSAGQMICVEPNEDGSVGWSVMNFAREDIPEYVWVELDLSLQEEVTALLSDGEDASGDGEVSQDEETQESEEQAQLDPETMNPKDKIEYYLDFMEEGKELVFEGNITFFGEEIQNISLENLRDILVEQGLADNRLYVSSLSPSEDIGTTLLYSGGAQAYADLPVSTMQMSGSSHFTSFGWVKEYPAGTATGILDINAGDSIETVLEKMGFTYASEIGETLRENADISVRWSSYHHGHESWSIADLEEGDKVSDSISIKFGDWNDYMEFYGFMDLTLSTMYKTTGSSSSSAGYVTLYFNENYELYSVALGQERG